MSPGCDGAPTPPNAGATNRQQNLNDSRVTRIGPPCGCAHGSAGHECGVGANIPETCSRRCQSLGVDELRSIGDRFGGCLCSPLPWVVAS